MEATIEQQHPTKAQWDEIAKRLDSQWSPVYLRCDGYLVSAQLVRTNANRLEICVGVNGWMYKGVWIGNDWETHEEPRRFWRRTKRQGISAKHLKLYEKLLGKRECRARGYYEPFVRPSPFWLRPRSFIAHLRKYSARIEILDYDTYSLAREVMRVVEAQTNDSEQQSIA